MFKTIKKMFYNSHIKSRFAFILQKHVQQLSVSAKCSCNQNNKVSPLKKALEDASSFDDVHPSNVQQKWATMPYPAGTNTMKKDDQFKESKLDPRDNSIILFPGQGSQYVGMAKNLLKFPMAKELFELANYILKYDLTKICMNGPKEMLDQTKYCQPAIMVTSLAAIEKLKEERPSAIENCVATAGFSLGEITALVFAGALEFERGIFVLFYWLE